MRPCSRFGFVGRGCAPNNGLVTGSTSDIKAAAARLRAGGVVAFPTETVYGLGADAFNPAAIDRVFAMKGRPRNNPLIVHVSGPGMAAGAAVWTGAADLLARAFWPGPLSMVLPRRDGLPESVTGGAGGGGVAVRCPDHPMALALLFEFGAPVVAPSANLSGRVSPTTAAHVAVGFPGADLLILDGGPCPGGIESTVVSLMERPARVLRPGLIGVERIVEVLGEAVIGAGESGRAGGTPAPLDAPLASPGLMRSHYAPRTPAVLFDAPEWPRVLGGVDRPVVVITHSGLPVPEGGRAIGMPREAGAYAARLYAALFEADAAGLAEIWIERPPRGGGVWEAVADRLGRATGG